MEHTRLLHHQTPWLHKRQQVVVLAHQTFISHLVLPKPIQQELGRGLSQLKILPKMAKEWARKAVSLGRLRGVSDDVDGLMRLWFVKQG